MAPVAAYTISQYLNGLYPNLSTILPGYDPSVAIAGVMALYWSYIFPDATTPYVMDEDNLSERQKYMIALRVAITMLPIVNGWLTSPQVLEAQAGPSLVKFQDLSKLLRVVMPVWQTDLNNLEAAEQIFFNLLPTVPAFLLRLSSVYPILGETSDYVGTPVIQSNAFFEAGNGPQYYGPGGLLLG